MQIDQFRLIARFPGYTLTMSRTDKAQTAEDKVNKVRELLRKDQ